MRAAIGLVAAAAMLSGCAAVVVPIAAGGTLGAKKLFGKSRPASPKPARREAAAASIGSVPERRLVTYLPAGSILPPPTGAAPVSDPESPARASAPRSPTGDAWRALLRYSATQAMTRPDASVVMMAGSSIANPRWVACGDKALAVIVDVELTGTPEAATTLDAFRTMGMAVVPMGGRPIPGVQRTAVAARYCVIAILGDQPGDFSDQLRDAGSAWAEAAAPVARLKGAGWFLAGSPTNTTAKTAEGTPD